ncbi:MAG: MmcQ/YjbR family DNA-binding protein [Acidobacteriia bacterium]|nr:MmcQ/YjbR family DNA-binding protein [Terriglobia bacterium]
MNVDWVRRYCLSLPHTTEKVQWGHDLVFKVGEKMYAVAVLEPGPVWLSVKCTPEEFAELTERPGIIPAPYAARASWIALESEDALPAAEIQRLVRQSYDLVFARLPKKRQEELGKKSKAGGKGIKDATRD